MIRCDECGKGSLEFYLRCQGCRERAASDAALVAPYVENCIYRLVTSGVEHVKLAAWIGDAMQIAARQSLPDAHQYLKAAVKEAESARQEAQP